MPAQADETLHMHSVAGAAKRVRGTRVRASQKGTGKRQRAAASAAAASAADVAAASAMDELPAQRTRAAPHND